MFKFFRFQKEFGSRMDKRCDCCGQKKPATREFFGSRPSGGLLGYCRTCENYVRDNRTRRRQRDGKQAVTGNSVRAGFEIQKKFASTLFSTVPKRSGTGINLIEGRTLINVVDYGADPGGFANSRDAIANAWNNPLGLPIFIPPGIYRLDATVNGSTIIGPNVDGTGIQGGGMWTTVLRASWTTGDVIQSPPATNGPFFQDLTITRTSRATTGYGLNMNPSNATCDDARINNLHLINHAVGLNLFTTGWGICSNVRSESNSNSGFRILGQWQLFNLFAALNGAHGFEVNSDPALPGSSMGQWRGLSSFNNQLAGIAFFGSAGHGIFSIRLSDSFFGADCLQPGFAEVYLDTWSAGTNYPHVLSNVFTEASANGAPGFLFTANNQDIQLQGCNAINNAGAGVQSAAVGNLQIMGGGYNGNALNGIQSSAGTISIVGAEAYGNRGDANINLTGVTAGAIQGTKAACSVSAPTTVTQTGNY